MFHLTDGKGNILFPDVFGPDVEFSTIPGVVCTIRQIDPPSEKTGGKTAVCGFGDRSFKEAFHLIKKRQSLNQPLTEGMVRFLKACTIAFLDGPYLQAASECLTIHNGSNLLNDDSEAKPKRGRKKQNALDSCDSIDIYEDRDSLPGDWEAVKASKVWTVLNPSDSTGHTFRKQLPSGIHNARVRQIRNVRGELAVYRSWWRKKTEL